MSLWRRSRALRITTWVVGAIAVLVVGPWALAYWSTEHALRAELQRIRDAGEPVSMADLVPPPVPDDQNAALVYARYYPPDGRGADDLTFARPGEAELLRRFQSDATVEPQVRRMLARPEVVEALAAIRRASQLPHAVVPDGTPERYLFQLARGAYHCADWLRARALLAARDGNAAQAVEWLAIIFRMADQLDSDPRMQFGGGVRLRGCDTGWRVLREADVPARQARALVQQIVTPDRRLSARQVVLAFRAQINDGFRGDVRAFASYLGLPLEDWPTKDRVLLSHYDSLLVRPIRNADQLSLLANLRGGLDVISAAATAAQLPRRGARGETSHLLNLLTEAVDYLRPISTMLPMADVGSLTWGGFTRAAARVNLFRTGLALVAHRQEHGAYPRTLADLRLPPGCDPTGDPFSGGPLKYARQGDGFILYSVGFNGVDDLGVKDSSSGGDIVESLPR